MPRHLCDLSSGVTSTVTSVNAPLVTGDPFITTSTATDLVALLKASGAPANLCSPPSLNVACLTIGRTCLYTINGKVGHCESLK